MLLTAAGDAPRLPLASGSVQGIITSPPYWGLRSYGDGSGQPWPSIGYAQMPGLPLVEIDAQHCQLGHEETPEAFIGHLVAVAREWRRVLHPTGVAWANLGDTYAGGKIGNGSNGYSDPGWSNKQARSGSLPPKNLIGIPWRAAFALQADGWLLRSAVVWCKRNPMPESVRGWRWERCRVKTSASRRANGEKKGRSLGGHPRRWPTGRRRDPEAMKRALGRSS